MASSSYWLGKRVAVTGAHGFIGHHVCEALQRAGVPSDSIVSGRRAEFDLRQLDGARRLIDGADVVIHLAAVTGGIAFTRARAASQYRESTLIDLNAVEAARLAGVKKLVALGNLFAYPAAAPLPLNEDAMFGPLPTDTHLGLGIMKRNLAVVARLVALEHGFNMSVVYAANAYGPGDSTDRPHAHVIPATIMKSLLDPEIVVWGDGTPVRDFLYASDLADGVLRAAEALDPGECVNVGSGRGVSIRELTGTIVRLAGFAGPVRYDESKKGGDTARVADVTRMRARLGWSPMIDLEDGLRRTIAWYRATLTPARA